VSTTNGEYVQGSPGHRRYPQWRTFIRRSALLASLVLTASWLLVAGGFPSAQVAAAAGSADVVRLQVEGSPVSDIATSAPTLTPAFAETAKDYVLRCQVGVNSITVTLAASAGGTIQVGSQSGSQVTTSVDLVESQALVVEAPDPADPNTSRVEYWIRCLPHDFPHLQVTRPGSPSPGWYLTGNIGSANGSGTYAMILNENGTPVWYQKTLGAGAIAVTEIAPNTVAWASNPGPGFGADPNGAFNVYDLETGATSQLTTVTKPMDFHELLMLSDGGRIMLATPLRASMDLSSLGLGASNTVVDCVIEEFDPQGEIAWRWRASEHVPVAESLHPFGVSVNGQIAYDIYHCNSVDRDPATGDLLLSMRHTDAVYRIDAATEGIVWKLGGNSVVADGAQALTIAGDPETTFLAQHDARFEPGGDVSLYDDHTWVPGAARGVEYHIDVGTGNATLVWQYQAPDGNHSIATGGFRRYSNGDDNLITWGIKSNTLFTEVDGLGNVLLDVTFPNGEAPYRAVKAPLADFDLDLLRQRAGLPGTALTFVGSMAQGFGDPAALAAILLDVSGNPVAGATVDFTLSSQSCAGVTDADGTATCTITPNEAAGVHTITASFAGNDAFVGSSASANFAVTLEETTLSYTGDTLIANDGSATMAGVLLEEDLTPISGRSVTFALGSGATEQTCSGVTNSSGTAICSITPVSQPLGPDNVGSSFAGDAFYAPASATATAQVTLLQTITFEPIPDMDFGAPDFTVSASASSGLDVTFSVGASDPCTISGEVVHLTGVGTCTVTAHQGGNDNYYPAPDVSRSFAISNPSLTVRLLGPGSGEVTSTPSGISCPPHCTQRAPFGTHLTLTATPDSGSVFAGWVSIGCAATDTCGVTLIADVTVYAAFDQIPPPATTHTLRVSKSGKGRILSDPTQINCGRECVGTYPEGAEVALTAKPRSGWVLKRWRYACSGKDLVCTVEMSSNRRAEAVFVKGSGESLHARQE
jgi:hypothetical protein